MAEKKINEKHLKSLYELISDGKRDYKDKALFMFERKKVDYSVSYEEFFEYVCSIARAFIHFGLGGKRIALIGETSVEWFATYLATVISGGEIVPLDLALSKEQFAGFINHSESDAVFYCNSWAEHIESHADDMPGVKHFVRLTDDVFDMNGERVAEDERFMRLSDFVKTGNSLKNIEIPEQNPEKMCALLFTSGTTGSSKGVMLSQKNICAVLNDAYTLLHQINEKDVLLSVLPVHHTYEMTCGILAPMMFGATIAINDSLNHVARNMQKYRPTVMALVPLFIEQLSKKIKNGIEKQGKTKQLEKAIRTSRALMKMGIDMRGKMFSQIRDVFGGRLRYIVSGGAALNPKLVDEFYDIGIKISQGYGITECAPLIAAVPFDVNNAKSCGKIIDHLQVFIDKAKSDDQYGEIVVKGDNVMMGYYKNQEATDEVLSRGWFYTGDLGYVDRDNYLYITGRKKNVIVMPGGKNVFPEELEEYLSDIKLIEECVVIGRESDGNVTITAIVYPNMTYAEEMGLTDKDEIYQKIKGEINGISRTLPGYKQIRKIEFRTEPFEKTSSKKIKRFSVK